MKKWNEEVSTDLCFLCRKPLVPSKRMALPSLTAPASASGGQSDLVEALFSPTKISSALRRKCTIVEVRIGKIRILCSQTLRK